MFIPGETLVHEFIIPFKYYTINRVIVTYKQENRVILEKTITLLQPYYEDEESEEQSCNCKPIPEYDVDELFDDDPTRPILPDTPSQTLVIVELIQQETLLFNNHEPVKIQLNVYFDNGTRIASSEICVRLDNQHYRQVITHG